MKKKLLLAIAFSYLLIIYPHHWNASNSKEKEYNKTALFCVFFLHRCSIALNFPATYENYSNILMKISNTTSEHNSYFITNIIKSAQGLKNLKDNCWEPTIYQNNISANLATITIFKLLDIVFKEVNLLPKNKTRVLKTNLFKNKFGFYYKKSKKIIGKKFRINYATLNKKKTVKLAITRTYLFNHKKKQKKLCLNIIESSQRFGRLKNRYQKPIVLRTQRDVIKKDIYKIGTASKKKITWSNISPKKVFSARAEIIEARLFNQIQIHIAPNNLTRILQVVVLITSTIIIYLLLRNFNKQSKRLYLKKEKSLQVEAEILKKNKISVENRLNVLTNIKIKLFKPEVELKSLEEPIKIPTEEKWLVQLKNSTILTPTDWMNFKKLFNKQYPSFLRNLNRKNETLTTAEKRFIMLKKITLTNQEMAQNLGIGTNAVHKTNSRIRQKLQCNNEELKAMILKM
jgi:hypothetical protein